MAKVDRERLPRPDAGNVLHDDVTTVPQTGLELQVAANLSQHLEAEGG